jgi:hypothetical protein
LTGDPEAATSDALVVPILATPFGLVPRLDAGLQNAALQTLFMERMRTDQRGRQRDPLWYSSSDDLLEWPEPPVRQLSAAIIRGMHSVIRQVNSFSEAQWSSFAMQARGRFTVVSPDGCVPASSHPLTAWCGIYCVAAPEAPSSRADSGVLRLYESHFGTMFADATNTVMQLPYTPGHYTWRPVPGQLVVFPGSLTHEIALVKSATPLVLVMVRMRFLAPGQQGVNRW